MSYKISDVMNKLEDIFPLENAMSYDNPGLLTGLPDTGLKAILLTLDCNSSAVKKASELGANLIVAHHPLIFGGISNVRGDDPTGRILTSLIRNDIALYACHTQLDCTDEFGDLAICDAVGIKAHKLEEAPIGCIGDTAPITLGDFSRRIREGLNASGVIFISDPGKVIKKVFVQGGAFDEDAIPAIIKSGADCVITGEMKHHHCVLLDELGIAAVLAGHNATERIYLPKLKNVLQKDFDGTDIFVDFGNERAEF